MEDGKCNCKPTPVPNPWHWNCGCFGIIGILIASVALAHPVGQLTTAIVEWLGRH